MLVEYFEASVNEGIALDDRVAFVGCPVILDGGKQIGMLFLSINAILGDHGSHLGLGELVGVRICW